MKLVGLRCVSAVVLVVAGATTNALASDARTPFPIPANQQELFALIDGCKARLKTQSAPENPIQKRVSEKQCQDSWLGFVQRNKTISNWRGIVHTIQELDGGVRVTFGVDYKSSSPVVLPSGKKIDTFIPMYMTTGYLPELRIREDDPLYSAVAALSMGQRVEVSGELVNAELEGTWDVPTIKTTVRFASITPL